MVDGFPYKEEVGGSNPSVPTILEILDTQISDLKKIFLRSRSSVG